MSDIGHNSIASDRLLSIIERIENLNTEKKEIQRGLQPQDHP